jgi:hypothetical protein
MSSDGELLSDESLDELEVQFISDFEYDPRTGETHLEQRVISMLDHTIAFFYEYHMPFDRIFQLGRDEAHNDGFDGDHDEIIWWASAEAHRWVASQMSNWMFRTEWDEIQRLLRRALSDWRATRRAETPYKHWTFPFTLSEDTLIEIMLKEIYFRAESALIN